MEAHAFAQLVWLSVNIAASVGVGVYGCRSYRLGRSVYHWRSLTERQRDARLDAVARAEVARIEVLRLRAENDLLREALARSVKPPEVAKMIAGLAS